MYMFQRRIISGWNNVDSSIIIKNKKTPVVRNGKQSTIGYKPEIWKEWK